MTLTNPYSFSFGGQVFGGSGSPYQILSVDGLEGLPTIRNQDDNRGYSDGMFTGQDFLGGRTISIIINTLPSGSTNAQTNFNTLQNYLLPQTSGTTPLYFFLSGAGAVEQFINARIRGNRTTIDPDYTYGFIKSQYEFFCPDPRYYDSTQQSASLSVSGFLGRVYNRIYPLLYNSSSASTLTTINNAGRTTTYPTITFNGPITNPVVGNVTQGNYIYFGQTFAQSDTVVIDLLNKIVTLNGAPARNLIVGGSNWFSAPVGNSSFYFNGSGTTGATAATATWYNAYI